MTIKKLSGMLSIILISGMFLIGCNFNNSPMKYDQTKLDDPIYEDFMRYVTEGLPSVEKLEWEVISAYEDVSGDNYINDEIMYRVLLDKVIPKSSKLIDKVEAINVDTKELRDIHEIYISLVNYNHSAFTTIMFALEEQDSNKVLDANEKLDLGRKKEREFLTEIEKLYDRYDITTK